MKLSKLFFQTLREAPSDAEVESHKLMVRAGLIRQLGAGVYSTLPLGLRAINKLENIMRDEINAIGGQELSMPVINPAEIWKETNRYYEIGSELGRFKDRKGADMVLAFSHEEIVGDLARKLIQSYKQLPMLVYHIQTKWRDDPRPRAGLIRVREFTMKDSYSLDLDEDGLDKQYRAHYQAYFNIFNRCGLPTVSVLADVGMMGGSMSHEYMYLTEIGEDTLLICEKCGYMANRQIAVFDKDIPEKEELLELEKVATPDISTIDTLAEFLDIPKAKTAKAVFLVATMVEQNIDVEKLVFAVVRGDMELNETKLSNAISAKEFRPALEEEIIAVGAVPGYASPIGINDVLIVVDDLIVNSPNLVAGANKEGFHLRNVNYERDFKADLVIDIAAAEEGFACPDCDEKMKSSRGVEVGNIFKLGTRYTDILGATYLDQNGKAKPIIMGSYGIGSGRLLASIIEEHHDKYGVIWPVSVAPYHVHLLSLKGGEDEADNLYQILSDEKFEVLYDDRRESPGVKFNDADLLGMPIRITVSKKSLESNSVEIKLRDQSDKIMVGLDDVIEYIQNLIADLEAALTKTVVEVPFKEN